MADDVARVREFLNKDAANKWGFVIYRCTYGDDDAWNRFMKHLDERTRLNLETYNASDLFSRIDWSVVHDADLEGADSEDVRTYNNSRRFSIWKQNSAEKDNWSGIPRYHACIRVDKFFMDAVLEGPPANEFDDIGMGFVELISLDASKGETFAGLSYLVPRIYVPPDGPGWENFAVRDDVATP
ncbi:hypothetical protein K504DRAFT_457523 [Pleomassaria siparia CBS 279.74]|uniref:Uncharacterized protein n=1 Tax=Pleomassaria siparia CBS 279.74 TaxID=1314801 RepID=A0A6G1KR28_9PLEO|nr:hypothetical protein K504DRAFT_457523 [Pleomassaria siparia CBS 279.74]